MAKYQNNAHLVFWGRGLFVGGLIAIAVSIIPILLLPMLPPAFSTGVLGILAAMLPLSIGPPALLTASVGAILLLVAWYRKSRP